MPTLNYRIESTGVNILKPVTDEVVYGLLSELDLTESFRDSVYIMSSFMAASQYANDLNVPNLLGKNRCSVEVNYVMDKGQVPWPTESPYNTSAYGERTSTWGNYSPILVDEKAGILMEHQTIACALDMSFTLTFTTFDEASKAFDTIQAKYKGSLIQKPFDLSFSYPISMGMLRFLVAAYKAKAEYRSKTLLDYVNDMKKTQISFDVRKSQLLREDADKELMVRCQQLQCLAQLTMDQKEPEVGLVEQLPDSYSISFNLIVQFGRPARVKVHTPISIDNTVLPFELFSNIDDNPHYNPFVQGVYQELMCSEFMSRRMGNFRNAQQVLRLPTYDDWFCVDKQYVFYKYRPLIIAHFTLDEGETTVINLKQLDVIELHPVVQAIIKETGKKIFDYGGIFNLGVYAGDLRMGSELLEIDDDLNLTITSARPDKSYHIVLSETTSLKYTDPLWDPILIKYRYFFPMTIERNLELLVRKKYFYISGENEFLSLISKLSKTGTIKGILKKLVTLGEVNNEIYSYTQSTSQLADYLANTQSTRENYTLPTGTSPEDDIIREFYHTKASVFGRSLFIAFIEQCLIDHHIELSEVPMQYIDANQTMYPYYNPQGGFYAFNTPIRIIDYTIET